MPRKHNPMICVKCRNAVGVLHSCCHMIYCANCHLMSCEQEGQRREIVALRKLARDLHMALKSGIDVEGRELLEERVVDYLGNDYQWVKEEN